MSVEEAIAAVDDPLWSEAAGYHVPLEVARVLKAEVERLRAERQESLNDQKITIACDVWKWRDRFGGFEAQCFIEKELGIPLTEVKAALEDRASDALMVAVYRGLSPEEIATWNEMPE